MNKVLTGVAAILAAVAISTVVTNSQDSAVGAVPSLEGTYMLISRDLPDGSVLKPPAVGGLLTFTKKYRNFNIFWKDAQGNPVSISYMASYNITAEKYTENCLYYMENNKGEGLKYNLEAMTASAPVMPADNGFAIKFPLWGEPTVTFSADKLTAVLEGAFTDHWVRVD